PVGPYARRWRRLFRPRRSLYSQPGPGRAHRLSRLKTPFSSSTRASSKFLSSLSVRPLRFSNPIRVGGLTTSEADITGRLDYVRFTPKSGHERCANTANRF